MLPSEVLRLPEQLARVDALFVPFFDPRVGQPSATMGTYRHHEGYERLCREVSDSITRRRFCRIPNRRQRPAPDDVDDVTTRCGVVAVDGCNEALLAKAAKAKLLRTITLRGITTVVPADVAYPTNSGLLAKAVRRIAVTGRCVQFAGGVTPTRVRDRSSGSACRAAPRPGRPAR